MQRLVVLGVVAACGSPHATHVSTPTDEAGRTPSRPDAGAPIAFDVAKTIDTSIAHIWAAPPPPPELPPHPDRDELDDAVPPVPRAREPGRRAPCFANRDVLVGSEIWRDLYPYAISMSSDKPPSGRYGSCTIADGQLRDAKGTLLAELHCGISVYVPGIIDHLGFEIGAHGDAIAAAHDEWLAAADATYEPPRLRAHPPDAMCWGEDAKQTRCWIGGSDAGSHYIFAATTAMPDRGPLRGPSARRFFESHAVQSFTVRITCH
jgi:hypothetical protein